MNTNWILGVTMTGLLGLSAPVIASDTVDAAIGGGLGGAAGAAIGNEVGGRDGAIVGGALGGAVGTAISTDDDHDHRAYERDGTSYRERVHYDEQPHNGGFCPPGQAKKGRC